MKTQLELEELFCLSTPWRNLPQFQIGTVVYCRSLGDYKVVRGIMYEDNYWVYFLQHHSSLVSTPEWALNDKDSYQVEHPICSYNLGDEIACDFYKIKRSIVVGIIFDSYWKVAIFNPNRINFEGSPRVEIVPDSYLKHHSGDICKP